MTDVGRRSGSLREQDHRDQPERHAGHHQGLGAGAGSTRVCTVVAVRTIMAVIGRNARPVFNGE